MTPTHYIDNYLIRPVHKVTVDLIGLGGNGSQMLTGLARINHALMALNHPGLHVRAWDDDKVSESNIGRQMFSQSDIGQFKSIVLTTRVNRFFGLEWEAMTLPFSGKANSNITISCVDSAKARIMIKTKLGAKKRAHPTDRQFYWLDIGNLQKTGQVVLGTVFPVKQPKKERGTRTVLPDIVKLIPKIKRVKEEDLGPSCSLAEALTKQDLFINSALIQFACALLWKMFREGRIVHHGCYVNLDSFIVNPIKIK